MLSFQYDRYNASSIAQSFELPGLYENSSLISDTSGDNDIVSDSSVCKKLRLGN